jgi:CMP-N-acetylneuraminic acid synthetase
MERVIEPPAEMHRRQDARPMHILNGAVYAVRTDWFRHSQTFVDKDTLAQVMPPERSVDIDTMIDMALARAILSIPTP